MIWQVHLLVILLYRETHNADKVIHTGRKLNELDISITMDDNIVKAIHEILIGLQKMSQIY